MRMTPPRHQTNSLTHFDNQVRIAFSHITGIVLNDSQWNQATGGLSQAGLGLRRASRHAPSASLASTSASRQRCRELDSNYTLDAGNPASFAGQALTQHNSALPQDKRLTSADLPGAKQKSLSSTLDEAGFAQRCAEECPAVQATLLSECQKGAREFWQAVPHRSKGTVLTADLSRGSLLFVRGGARRV